MAGKRAPVWRTGFLQALARTGNVRVSAAAAGVSHDKAYALRNADKGFGRAWTRALDFGRARVAAGAGAARTGVLKALPGAEMSVRVSKNAGTQLVRVGPGKWNKEAEKIFVAELARTSNVRASARAAGFSNTAVYQRRMRNASFAEKWAEALAQASADIDMALARGAKIALGALNEDEEDGWAAAGGAEHGAAAPADEGVRLTAKEAMEVAKMLRPGDAAGAAAGGLRRRSTRARRPVPIEKIRDEVLRRLDAIRRHRARQAESRGGGDGGGAREGDDSRTNGEGTGA